MIALSEELQRALDAQPNEPVSLVDRRTDTPYILIRADLYERMRVALAADASDVRGAYPLMDAVAQREGWDDPEMASYDVYARKPQP